MIDVHEAVGYDAQLHGRRFILLECGAGALLFGSLGVVEFLVTAHATAPFLRAQSLFFVSLMVNCLTLLIIALRGARRMAVAGHADLDPRRMRRYTLALPLLILCPIVLPLVAVSQGSRGASRS